MDNPYKAPRGSAGTWDRVGELSFRESSVGRNSGPEGLGGWLILVAIGLLRSAVVVSVTTMRDLVPVFADGQVWTMLDPGASGHAPLYGLLVCAELVANIVLVIWPLVLLGLFFAKSRWFPSGYIGLVVASFVIHALDLAAAYGLELLAEGEFTRGLFELAPLVASAAIWIPYMLVSKRVKNTFRY